MAKVATREKDKQAAGSGGPRYQIVSKANGKPVYVGNGTPDRANAEWLASTMVTPCTVALVGPDGDLQPVE